MLPIDLDVTRSVRAFMASCRTDEGLSLERVHDGLREAVWYSPRDRRQLRAICDEHPQRFTRWLFDCERDGRYTGLIMVWPAGHATPIHDHAGLWGIELVLQGALGVEDHEFDGERMRHVGTTVLEEGQSCAFLGVGGHAHRCTNLSARRTAVTLHVYGGLLDAYRNYELGRDGHYLVQPTIAPIDGRIGPARPQAA